MSDQDKHIEETSEKGKRVHSFPSEPLNFSQHSEDENDLHMLQLSQSDPAFIALQSKGLKPIDDYQEILESLEESEIVTARDPQVEKEPIQSTSKAEIDQDSSTEEVVVSESNESVQDETPEDPQHQAGSMKLEPLSEFVQWLIRLEKPKALDVVEEKEPEKVQVATTNTGGLETQLIPEQERAKLLKGEKQDVTSQSNKVEKSDAKSKAKDKGVRLSADVISETLAEVLASQGHRNAAIEMYEKLSLIYPEKKSFFAVKIKNLKKT